MGVKSLTLWGLIISIAFIYMCIETKKDKFYASIHNQPESQLVKKESLPTIATKKEKPKKAQLEPSFAYVSGVKSKIAAVLSTNDKNGEITNMIESICGRDGCVKDLKFSDNIKEFEFTQDILALINNSIDKDIENFSIYMDKKSLKLNGVAKNREDIDSFLKKIEHFSQKLYKIKNNIHTLSSTKKLVSEQKENVKVESNSTAVIVIKETIENQAKKVEQDRKNVISTKPKKEQKVKIQKSEIKSDKKEAVKKEKTEPKKIEKRKKVEVKKEKIVVKIKKKPQEKKAVKKIVKPKPKPIHKVSKDVKVEDIFVIPNQVDPQEAAFRIEDLLYAEPIVFDGDSAISSESQNTLHKIADIISGLNKIKVIILAYSNSLQGEAYDRVLSQKRADMVKKILVRSGVRSNIIRTKGYSSANQNEIMNELDTIIKIEIKE